MNAQNIWKFAAGAAVTALVLFLVWYFSSIVVYILVSAVLAVMGRPMVRRLEGVRVRSWHLSRTLAAAVTLLLIWAVTAVVGMLFVPLVFDKLYELANLDFAAVMQSIEAPVVRAQQYLSELFALPTESFSLSESLMSTVREWVNLESVNKLFSSTLGILFSTVIAFFSISFITFFFLKEDNLFYAMVTAAFPEKYAENITRALDSITHLLSRYFRGILTESLLLMVAVSLVMTAFGMRASDAAFVGLLMGVMNVVPYAGPLIGGVLSVCVGIVSPIEGMTIGQTMGVMISSLLVLKGIDDFMLQPTLYSERVKAHPLEVFIVILIAGSAAGILGMLLAIPAYTVLRVFAKEFFSQFSLVRKLTKQI